uniref:Uncharacterized protein n=1 Tax=Arundo donax TaxID=35708 RepID=A0A0A9F888_ARUDO
MDSVKLFCSNASALPSTTTYSLASSISSPLGIAVHVDMVLEKSDPKEKEIILHW